MKNLNFIIALVAFIYIFFLFLLKRINPKNIAYPKEYSKDGLKTIKLEWFDKLL